MIYEVCRCSASGNKVGFSLVTTLISYVSLYCEKDKRKSSSGNWNASLIFASGACGEGQNVKVSFLSGKEIGFTP